MCVDDRLAPSGEFLPGIGLGGNVFGAQLAPVMIFGPAGTAQFIFGAGLRAAFAYLIFARAVAGGILLVLGIQARWVVLALLGAIIWVHGANVSVLTAPGGAWEDPASLMIASLALALLGDGAYALMPWGFASKKRPLKQSAQGQPA